MHRVWSWSWGQYTRLRCDVDDNIPLLPTNNTWPWLNRPRSVSTPVTDDEEDRARDRRTGAIDLTLPDLTSRVRNPGMVFIREQENRRVRVNIDPVNIRRRSSADGKQEVLQDFYAFPDIDVPLMSDEDHKAEMQEETKEREEGFLAPLDTAINPFAKEFDQTAYVRYLQKEMRKPTDELGQVRLNEDVIAAAQLLAPESSAQAIAILEAENEKLIPGRGKPLPKDPRKDSKFDTDTDYSVAGPSDLEETSDLAPSVDPPASIGVEVIDMVGRPIPTPAERQTIVDAVDAEEVLQPGQIDI